MTTIFPAIRLSMIPPDRPQGVNVEIMVNAAGACNSSSYNSFSHTRIKASRKPDNPQTEPLRHRDALPLRSRGALPMQSIVPWYFAYGSNMQTATFRGRRGIEFRAAVAGYARGWRIVFDKPPIVPMREAYANIVRDPNAAVWGVVYEISDDDLAHVELTEGVLIGNYERAEIEVLCPPRSQCRVAFTLTSDRADPTLLPSQRYLGLLIDGASEHGLPQQYVELLRAVPTGAESPEAAAFRPFMDEALRRR